MLKASTVTGHLWWWMPEGIKFIGRLRGGYDSGGDLIDFV